MTDVMETNRTPITTALRANFYYLGKNIPGYDEVFVQALFALVTGENLFWVSRPGRAKTLAVNSMFGMFPNTRVFYIQFTKDTMPDNLFGNPIPDELMKTGREIVNLEGGLAMCEFAHLGEFMDGTDFTVRASLDVLNEHQWSNKDMGTIASPLHMAVATTNFMRLRDATEAVLDRFLCKAYLQGIESLTDCMRAGQTYLKDHGEPFKLPYEIDFAELKALSERILAPEGSNGITISPGMRLLHVLLVKEFQIRRQASAIAAWKLKNPNAAEEPPADEVIVPEVTPRTLVKLHDFSRAAAALNDRDSVIPDDQRALGYGIYTVGDESGDGRLWHTLCDEYLALTETQVTSLEELGEIADAVGKLKAERSEVTSAQLRFGGHYYEIADLAKHKFFDKLRSTGKHPVIDAATAELEEEIKSLNDLHAHTTFDLLNGWSK